MFINPEQKKTAGLLRVFIKPTTEQQLQFQAFDGTFNSIVETKNLHLLTALRLDQTVTWNLSRRTSCADLMLRVFIKYFEKSDSVFVAGLQEVGIFPQRRDWEALNEGSRVVHHPAFDHRHVTESPIKSNRWECKWQILGVRCDYWDMNHYRDYSYILWRVNFVCEMIGSLLCWLERNK